MPSKIAVEVEPSMGFEPLTPHYKHIFPRCPTRFYSATDAQKPHQD